MGARITMNIWTRLRAMTAESENTHSAQKIAQKAETGESGTEPSGGFPLRMLAKIKIPTTSRTTLQKPAMKGASVPTAPHFLGFLTTPSTTRRRG